MFEKFEERHNASDPDEIKEMLHAVKADSLDALIAQTVPPDIRLKKELNLTAMSEPALLSHMKALMSKNKAFKTYIGMGYYNCFTPGVIQRNILENPGWYTAYTPYQAEIAQGRLEALMNFQTMISDLCGLPIANASLLDEATAAAEAMSMLYAMRKNLKAKRFLIDENVFPQVIDVLRTRAEPLGISAETADISAAHFADENIFGVYLQNPGNNGAVTDYEELISQAHEKDILVAVGADLMSLLLVKSPGEMGADAVVGNSQRFGVPIGYGGPHAGFFAAREEFKRYMPGRIIGLSVDAQGKPAFRMALQTREQHIRREKATSNICTAQVLLAVLASMYAVYHGPVGLKKTAMRIHRLASSLATALGNLGFENSVSSFFGTLHIKVPNTETLHWAAEEQKINFRYFETHVGISIDETTAPEDIEKIVWVFEKAFGKHDIDVDFETQDYLPEPLRRVSPYLTHPVFHVHHSEHDMLRYIKKLENKDLSMVHSMIPLGSCTMKLNATSEMQALSWSEVNLHPFVPVDQALGYQQMIVALENMLKEITGFTGVSLQPNSGAQGEYAGLLTIRAYHKSRNEDRKITLIPASAHGTNPASAVLAGMTVIVVKSDAEGKIDTEDLKQKAAAHEKNLAALMVTYPSTHGVFEESIAEICEVIHRHGGLVYMDGANMNAQVGLTSPAVIGADVCHLNLHKTFAIPHGGGGPGAGPICVNEKLEPFLPGHSVVKMGGNVTAVSGAPWGSASILTISYAYIALMGAGLRRATELAILKANYLKEKLSAHYKILYTGTSGRCAHELIVDCREFKASRIEVEDIAKRLMDYGFHAPTVSFPVVGTLMIEPTESEPLSELNRFVEAMVSIRNEIREVENGIADTENNVLKNAPHTATVVCADEWAYPYSRRQAAYPLPYLEDKKFWPSVSRVDNAYGDRNLICSCQA